MTETHEYIATFGHGQTDAATGEPLKDCYVRLLALDREGARAQMFERFGGRWAFLYDSPQEAGVERWGLRDISARYGLPYHEEFLTAFEAYCAEHGYPDPDPGSHYEAKLLAEFRAHLEGEARDG